MLFFIKGMSCSSPNGVMSSSRYIASHFYSFFNSLSFKLNNPFILPMKCSNGNLRFHLLSIIRYLMSHICHDFVLFLTLQ